jgi:hypothetical protein
MSPAHPNTHPSVKLSLCNIFNENHSQIAFSPKKVRRRRIYNAQLKIQMCAIVEHTPLTPLYRGELTCALFYTIVINPKCYPVVSGANINSRWHCRRINFIEAWLIFIKHHSAETDYYIQCKYIPLSSRYKIQKNLFSSFWKSHSSSTYRGESITPIFSVSTIYHLYWPTLHRTQDNMLLSDRVLAHCRSDTPTEILYRKPCKILAARKNARSFRNLSTTYIGRALFDGYRQLFSGP